MQNSLRLLTFITTAYIFGSPIAPARSADAPQVKVAVPSDEELARFTLRDPGQELPECRVTIGSRHLDLIVDTGSSQMVLDQSIAQELGLIVIGQQRTLTASQTQLISWARRPALQFAGVTFPAAGRCILVDLEPLRRLRDVQFDGILGMDVLRSFAIEFNWSEHQLRILRSPVTRSGYTVPIEYDNHGTPTMKAELAGGRIARFLVDSGSRADVSVVAELFSELVAKGRCRLHPVPSPRFDLLGNPQFYEVGQLEHILLEGNRSADVVLDSDDMNILGTQFFSRFIVTFDFPKKLAYFNKVRDTPLPQDVSGLAIERLDGEVHVIAVSDPSPAHAAGLKEGDFIVTCESKLAKTLKLADIRRRCQDPTAVLPLTVRRDGTTFEVQLDLRPEPEPAK